MAHQLILNPISREFFSTKIVSPPVSMEPSKYLSPKIIPTPILLPSEPLQFGSYSLVWNKLILQYKYGGGGRI